MIRILFSKKGYARYISHLDLQRTMQRAIKRSGIPIKMTEGFNPHPYLCFSPPLSVGTEGNNEILDIKLREDVSENEIKEKLSEAMPSGLGIVDVYTAERDLKEICFAEYTLRLNRKEADTFNEFLSQDQINIIKKTKKSSSEIDLKKEAQFSVEDKDTGFNLKLILPCGNERNVNPLLFIEAFRGYSGKDFEYYIERIHFLDRDKEIFR